MATGDSRLLACIFNKMLDYHFARMEYAESAAAARNWRTVSIEVSGGHIDYDWKVDAHRSAIEPLRLFPDLNGSRFPPSREICRRLLRALKSANPAAIVTQGYRMPWMRAANGWAKSAAVGCVMTTDSTFGDRPRSRIKEMVKRWLLRKGDVAFVAGSRAGEYARSLGFPDDRIFYGIDCVDNAAIRARADQTRLQSSLWREKLRLPRRFFLYVGRLHKVKNVPFLIRCYLQYKTQLGEDAWPLVLCGSGPQEVHIRNLISDAELADNVKQIGFVQNQELPAYMALANCFILPSVSEPWGLVVNEAMACGLPVLVSDRCGCCPELVKGDVNGWTFDPCSESALVDLMVRMTGMPEPRRAQLGQASQAIVAEWGLERHARSLFDAADYALRLRRGTTG